MKKLLSLTMLLLFVSSIAFAQVEKGKWFIAGYSNLGLDIGKEKYEYPDGASKSSSVSEYKYTEFDFNPYVGYFVIEKLPVGLFIDYSYWKEKEKDDDYSWKSTSMAIGPFVRYYITELKGFYPYAEGKIGFGSSKEIEEWDGGEEEYKMNLFTYKFGIGSTYFLTQNVGLDLFLGYDYDSYKYKGDEDVKKSTNSADMTESYSSLEVNLGIIVTLGK
jgi:outer membrane protein